MPTFRLPNGKSHHLYKESSEPNLPGGLFVTLDTVWEDDLYYRAAISVEAIDELRALIASAEPAELAVVLARWGWL